MPSPSEGYVRVRIEGESKVIEHLDTAPAFLKKRVDDTAQQGADLIAARARTDAHSFESSGSYVRGISGRVEHSGSRVRSVAVASARHSAVIEKGRAAGRKAPPTKAPEFLHWLTTKGIPLSAAFVIARAIGRKGIKARGTMGKARDATRAQVRALWRDVGDDLARHLRG